MLRDPFQTLCLICFDVHKGEGCVNKCVVLSLDNLLSL